MRVREKIGPVAAFKVVGIAKRLPKTRSGKVLRAIMRNIADSEPYTVPTTIDELLILDEIEQSLKALGYAGA
jgi:propionyl-CoA synthetase